MIIRTPDRHRYLVMSKIPLEDARLTWRARGMLAYLLSKPDNWVVMVAELDKASPDGAHTVRQSLRELEEAGYLRRTKRRGGAGRFDGTDSEIYEEPCNDRGNTVCRNTTCGESARGDTACGKSHANEELTSMITERVSKESKDGSASRAADPLFEAVCKSFGVDWTKLTSQNRGPYNVCTAALRKLDLAPEDVERLHQAYRGEFPHASDTPTAVAKHAPQLVGRMTETPRERVRFGL